jgi:hypothetical protein
LDKAVTLADFAVENLLVGKHLTIGLRNMSLFSERTIEDVSNPEAHQLSSWQGYDVTILKELALRGRFTYDVEEIKLNHGEEYEDFLVREAVHLDIIANNFGDTPKRRSKNIAYTARTGRRQDLWLFGPKPVIVPEPLTSQLTSFLAPFSYELWALFFLYIVFSAFMMYKYEAKHAEKEKRKEAAEKKTSTLKIQATRTNSKRIFTDDKNDRTPVTAGMLVSFKEGLMMEMVEHLQEANMKAQHAANDQEDSDDAEAGFLTSFHKSWIEFTGAGGHECESPYAKFYQASWSFVVLIVVASYTAELASFLTRKDVPKQAISSITDVVSQQALLCYTIESADYVDMVKHKVSGL